MRNRWLALPFFGLIINVLSGVTGSATAMPACTASNPLYGIAATSAKNVWAVGACNGAWTRTLIEHWNGQIWRRVASPNPGHAADRYDDLNDVTAVSDSRAWAVGKWGSPDYPRTLILSWNGTTWRRVPSPSPGGGRSTNELYDVTAVSASNAWAVGDSDLGKRNSPVETLILHWNGQVWRRVPSPHPGPISSLNAVAAVSRSDAWAVGFYADSSGDHTLTERWNGKVWRRVPSPDVPGCSDISLADVAVAARSSAWADGSCYDAGVGQTVTERWGGNAWHLVPSPDPGSNTNSLGAVIDVRAHSIWATGYYNDSGLGPSHALLLRWTGAAWQQTSVLGVGTTTFTVGPIVAVSRTDMWALGTVGALGHNLVLRWNGADWRRAPGPG